MGIQTSRPNTVNVVVIYDRIAKPSASTNGHDISDSRSDIRIRRGTKLGVSRVKLLSHSVYLYGGAASSISASTCWCRADVDFLPSHLATP